MMKSKNNASVNRRKPTISQNAISQFAMTVITGKLESDMRLVESATFELRTSSIAVRV